MSQCDCFPGETCQHCRPDLMGHSLDASGVRPASKKPACPDCAAQDAEIAQLTARVAEVERGRDEGDSFYLDGCRIAEEQL